MSRTYNLRTRKSNQKYDTKQIRIPLPELKNKPAVKEKENATNDQIISLSYKNSPSDYTIDLFFLPREIELKILMFLPHNDVIKYCQTCKKTSDIFNDDYFWKGKAKYDLGLSDQLCNDLFNAKNITRSYDKYKYLMSCYEKDYFTKGWLHLIVLNKMEPCLYKVIDNNDIHLLDFFFTKLNINSWSNFSVDILMYAFQHSNVDIIDFLVERIEASKNMISQILNAIYYNIENKKPDVTNCKDIRHNPHNYKIIEYLLKKIFYPNASDDVLNILITIPFDAKAFKLIYDSFYSVRQNTTSLLFWSYNRNKIDIVEWLLNNNHVKSKYILELSFYLVDDFQKRGTYNIERLARTGKLDINMMKIESHIYPSLRKWLTETFPQ